MIEALAGVYCGPAPLPDGIWSQWNGDPVLLAALALAAYALRRSTAGLAGIAVLVVAFVSPLCALSAALFSARVVHHVLLLAAAAPLLALALPRARDGVALPFTLFTVLLWIWHLPVAYDAALSNYAVYWLMQATLLGSALAFWQAVFSPSQAGGGNLLALLAAYVQMALLGALLTFAPDALYAVHATAPLAWGFTALADQQLGGLIMWVPAGLPFALWGGWLARRAWRQIGSAHVV